MKDNSRSHDNGVGTGHDLSLRKPLRFVAAGYIALTLLACNLISEPPTIYVTATPNVGVPVAIAAEGDPAVDDAAQIEIPPTNTPQPTVEPTPTIPPDTLLRVAERAQLNGYYEEAVGGYRDILNQGSPDDIRASAAFGLGEAALREGLFTQAVEALTLLIEQYPDDPRMSQALFLRGDAYLGLSLWNEGQADFQRYLQVRPGLIDSYAYERIGDAQLALSQRDAALASYSQALEARRSLVPQVLLREKVAQIYLAQGQVNEAVGQYDAILAVAQNAPYRAQIELAAAEALVGAGALEPGLARAQRVFEQSATSATAYRAMELLQANERVLDPYATGNVRYSFGDYQGAIDAYEVVTTTWTLDTIPPQLYLSLGRAYRQIGNPDAAQVAFQTIIDQYSQTALFGEALLEQGRTHFLSGDIPLAITQYSSIAENYAYLPEAAEALWRVGYLQGTNGMQVDSLATFERLASEYPESEWAASGLRIGASSAVSTGNVAAAERLFARLATTTTGEDQAAAYLWVGRLALERGDTAAAQNALPLAIAAAPDSYFAARANDIVNGITPFQPPAQFQFEFDDVAQLAEAEAWLRTSFGVTQEGALWPLSSLLTDDPRMIRGNELWAVAAYDEAVAEFDDLIGEYSENGLASYQLAIYMRSIAAYQQSIVAAANTIRAAGVGTLDAPAYIARMRYPAYYLNVVQDVSARRGFDPLVLFSLMRQESLFNTNATAAAGEKGLTQVIPGTGEYIANQIDFPDYQHSDLFRPYAGIEFGAYYLDEQLERFDGNTIAALAGYNAGPGRAIDWLALAGNDPDAFMTTITIDSTRGYVQRIYSNYNIYRALYGTG